MKKKAIYHYALSAFIMGGISLSLISCSDDNVTPDSTNENEPLVRFTVNDVQELAIERGLETTRGSITTGISASDLFGRKLVARNNRGLNACFIETAVEGVNPIKIDAHTRAQIKTNIDGDFSSSGIHGANATNILSNPEWFHAVKTKSDGELYVPTHWEWTQPYARFFAVYPETSTYSKMTIGNTTDAGSPEIDFEVETDVTKQVDLMTACTGDVQYATRREQPAANLSFRHALTAVHFAIGQNLSWNKTIDRIEIRDAVMKSKYTLSKNLNGTGATWKHSADTRGNATLSGLNINTSQNPNVIITGNNGDNYTFYMIPQVLDGNNVRANVHCTDGTEFDVILQGEWKAGTTITYKLSETTSTWTYTFNVTGPTRNVNYNETTSEPYGITSYRTAPDGTQKPVAWKVIGYDADNDGTFSMNEKPAWITSLSKTEGEGGTAAEQGTATLTNDVVDLLKVRNESLKNATPLGSASNYYDLSTKGGTVPRSTANCYVVSAPGFYRIPLVYGNAITNGTDNPNSYKTTNTGKYILTNFKDHNGNDITNSWIEKSNTANAGIDGAKIIWADEANIVHLASGSAAISRDASGNAFLQFEVKASDIKSGNAVIAATKNGTVVWSWHLWFAPQSALNTIEVTNHQNVKYNFTTETLGWHPTKWEGTTYDKPRTVKVRVEQDTTNNGTKQVADITITQTAANTRIGTTTIYQFGRKDAFPGTDEDLAMGGINKNADNDMSCANSIQNPGNYYTWGNTWHGTPPTGYSYYNLWSMSCTKTGFNDNVVVKTIYDPSPAGFKLPASNAFTGFTDSGDNNGKVNADRTTESVSFQNNFGHNFWTNSNHNATIFFPASGYRVGYTGLFGSAGKYGFVWSAIPNYASYGCYLSFTSDYVDPQNYCFRADALSVRPVSE